MAQQDYRRILATAIDGRMHTVFHRQEQLERLCQILINSVEALKDAISKDYHHSPAEIAVEYSMAVNAVKRCYALLKPKDLLEEEYLIANGKNAAERRVPVGIVYVEPIQHTLLYSVVAPLAAAFAAGNCVVVLLENNLRSLPGLLRRLLTEALDPDVFAVASSPITDERLLSKSLSVLQAGVQENVPRLNQLTHFADSSIVAVVDRTANIDVAARELVAARFSFGGRSPYAPDVVLVNEFRKKDFLQAVVRECVQSQNGVEMNGDVKGQSNTINDSLEALKKMDPALRTIVQENKFAVVDVTSREAVLRQNLSGALLLVHGVRSLDDAIDMVSSRETKSCLAGYHFCSHAAGKYLSQFINAEVSFVNHIPRELLIGPVFPTNRPVNGIERSPLDIFTLPRPAFVHTSRDESLTQALSDTSSSTARKLLADAVKPLVEVKRHPGGSLGFFEVGFLMSAGLILSTTLTLSSAGVIWWWRHSRAV